MNVYIKLLIQQIKDKLIALKDLLEQDLKTFWAIPIILIYKFRQVIIDFTIEKAKVLYDATAKQSVAIDTQIVATEKSETTVETDLAKINKEEVTAAKDSEANWYLKKD